MVTVQSASTSSTVASGSTPNVRSRSDQRSDVPLARAPISAPATSRASSRAISMIRARTRSRSSTLYTFIAARTLAPTASRPSGVYRPIANRVIRSLTIVGTNRSTAAIAIAS